MVELLGWRSVFIINVPVVVALVILVPRVIPRPVSGRHVSLRLGPSLLITVAIGLLIYALSNLEESGPLSVSTIVPFIAGLIVAAGFVVTEVRSRDPLISRDLLHSRQRRGALGVMLGLPPRRWRHYCRDPGGVQSDSRLKKPRARRRPGW
jgi:hypothetical protein